MTDDLQDQRQRMTTLTAPTEAERENARLRARRNELRAELGRIDMDEETAEENEVLESEIEELENQLERRSEKMSKFIEGLDKDLEDMAKRAARDGETTAKAYDRLHRTDAEFRKVLKLRDEAQRVLVEPGPSDEIEKSSKATVADIDKQLETLAKKHAENHRVSFAKAYDAVLQTPEGRELYAAQSSAQDLVIS